MRTSSLTAAVLGAVVLVAAAIGAALFVPWETDPTVPPPPPPLVIEKPPTPPADQPEEKAVMDVLDRVEAAETERFGAAEAARRRRTREQMIDGRRTEAE